MSATLIVAVWIHNPLSIRSKRVRKRKDPRELLPYHRRVLPILKTRFPLLGQVTLLWTVMETIRAVMQVAHPVAHRQSIRRHHLGHLAKAAHPLPIKEYNKALTKIQALIRTILKNNIYGRRETRCLNKESSINRTRPDRIILHTYRMSTEDIRVVTCRRTTLLDRICTTDTPAVNKVPLVIPRERLLMRGATAILRDRRLIRSLCNSKRRLASLPRLRNRQLCHHTRVRKTTIDRNKVDMERPLELKYIPQVDRLTRTCHHPLQVPLNLDATQTLPKTNSIPNIINNDQRIQDGQIQLINTIVIVETIGFNTQASRHNRHHNNHNRNRRNKELKSSPLPQLLRQSTWLVINNGPVSHRIGPHPNHL